MCVFTLYVPFIEWLVIITDNDDVYCRANIIMLMMQATVCLLLLIMHSIFPFTSQYYFGVFNFQVTKLIIER